MFKSSTKKNFIYYYVYQLTILLSTIITMPYISKVLGSEMVGIYSYTFSIANFIYMFAQLGTYTYGVREIALNKESKNDLSKCFIEIVLMKAISTTIFLSIYLIFIGFQTNYIIYFYIWILFVISSAFDITWFYAGIEHFEEIFLINITIRVIGIISIFLLVNNENDLWKYVVIHSLLYLLPFALMWISLYKYIVLKGIRNLNIFNHLKQSLIYFIPTISASLFIVIDKSMLGTIIEDKNESGYYEMASQIVIFSKTLSAIVISHIIQPKTTYYYKVNNTNKIKESINLSIEFAAFLCIGMIFGIFAVAHDFVPIFFSTKFLPIENILKLMSPLMIITAISYIYEYEYLIPAGKGKSINKHIITSAIINIILNLILIKNLKSTGVVIASIITELVLLFYFYKESNSIVNIQNILHVFYKKIIAGIIMFIIIFITNYYFNYIGFENRTVMLVIEILIGIVSYLLSLFIIKDNIIHFITNLNNI